MFSGKASALTELEQFFMSAMVPCRLGVVCMDGIFFFLFFFLSFFQNNSQKEAKCGDFAGMFTDRP